MAEYPRVINSQEKQAKINQQKQNQNHSAEKPTKLFVFTPKQWEHNPTSQLHERIISEIPSNDENKKKLKKRKKKKKKQSSSQVKVDQDVHLSDDVQPIKVEDIDHSEKIVERTPVTTAQKSQRIG